MQDAADLAAWAASGAMSLTGPADGAPTVAPASVASAMHAAAHDLATQSSRWGHTVQLDGPALLGERAALTAMTRNGSTSVGGSARFVRCVDDWVALNLPRPDDVAALPALVGMQVEPDDWPVIEAAIAASRSDDLVAQAASLGIAVGRARERPSPASPVSERHRGGPRSPRARPLVVDLGSLWAGPLAGGLLRAAGARVIKVEGRTRPDGARRGSTAFFDLLNAGKEMVTVDFADRADVALFHAMLGAADLVIEASRPRAMDQIGVDPAALADAGTSWLSITGHGRVGDAAMRVGFGDDAAVEGGLWCAGDGAPWFVADAVADPLTGLVAAAFGAELLAEGRAAVIEAPLARAASWAARPSASAPVESDGDGWSVLVGDERIPVAPPRARPAGSAAPAPGAHDAEIRAEFGA
ncbi:MAG: CoA transferase [Actinomycetota bacterium]